jgi:hypothetical protein
MNGGGTGAERLRRGGKWSKEGGFLPLRTMAYIGDDEDGPAWAQGRSIQPTGGELDGRGWSVAPGGTRS